MENIYTKRDLENLEDRYEFLFPVPYETKTTPDQLVEMKEVSFAAITRQLVNDGFSLLVCIPHLPVVKAFKQAEVLSANHSFRFLRIPHQDYQAAIEECLMEHANSLTFFLVQDVRQLQYELPKTSHESIKLVNMSRNELYSFWIEDRECTVARWH
ncbi:hypothetical protein ACSFXN_07190 [Planococcus sp. 1R117A]|uniref:hypothetical protein n=1 Tax=Planococcus sp. 1R117A TaxID=3447020 RepID=UPI003EDC78BC